MKTINVTFTDDEYKQLLNAKNSANWHDYILNKCVQSDHKEKMSPETQEGRSIPRSFSHDQTHIGPVRDNSSCVDESTKEEGV